MSSIQVNKLHAFTGHRDCVYTVADSGSGSTFFSAGGDGMVVQWGLEQLNEGELLAKLPNSVYALHHHPASGLLVVGHNYDGIHLLNWQQKKEEGSLNLTRAAIFDIAFDEDDLLIATGVGEVIQVDLKSLQVKRKVMASEKSARVFAINKKQGEVAVGYSDNFIRIFSLPDLKLKIEFQAHQNSVFTLTYTPDSNFLISGSRDARLKVWDVNSGYTQAEEIVAHMFAINHVAISPTGKYFATASMDKSIKIWDAQALKLLKVVDKARHAGHGTSVNKLLWLAPDRLVSASDDRSVSLWDLRFS